MIPEGHVLVTPVEKVSVEVEDAPFLAGQPAKERRKLVFTTNVGDEVAVGRRASIALRKGRRTASNPMCWCATISGRWSRARCVFDLAELAQTRLVDGRLQTGVSSQGQFFVMDEEAGARRRSGAARMTGLTQNTRSFPPKTFARAPCRACRSNCRKAPSIPPKAAPRRPHSQSRPLQGGLGGRSRRPPPCWCRSCRARMARNVLLTRRSTALRRHAGQVAFPGGRIDPEDDGPIDAALREAEEEIGLDRDVVTPLGFLDVYLTHSGFRILPLVAMVTPPFGLLINPEEVDEAFEVPLQFLMEPANHVAGIAHARRRDAACSTPCLMAKRTSGASPPASCAICTKGSTGERAARISRAELSRRSAPAHACSRRSMATARNCASSAARSAIT